MLEPTLAFEAASGHINAILPRRKALANGALSDPQSTRQSAGVLLNIQTEIPHQDHARSSHRQSMDQDTSAPTKPKA